MAVFDSWEIIVVFFPIVLRKLATAVLENIMAPWSSAFYLLISECVISLVVLVDTSPTVQSVQKKPAYLKDHERGFE